LLLKRHFERIAANGDLLLPLREYPAREVLAVYALCHTAPAGKKYIRPKKPGCGEEWKLVISVRITVEGIISNEE
jgi:hypothetical protein